MEYLAYVVCFIVTAVSPSIIGCILSNDRSATFLDWLIIGWVTITGAALIALLTAIIVKCFDITLSAMGFV
jgi:hypothetical protein